MNLMVDFGKDKRGTMLIRPYFGTLFWTVLWTMTQIFSLWSFNDKVLQQQQQKKAQPVDVVGS